MGDSTPRGVEGADAEEIAVVLGKSHVAVGHWLRGRSRPDPPSRKKLEDLYGIPFPSLKEPVSGFGD
jgi:transcriptional regulator with XRE-family HTH domain